MHTDTHVSTHDAAEDARNDDIRIYVNGEIVHRDDAKISVYDSGFLLGDGVWEGLRLYDGHIPFLAEHLDRLFEAALYIDLEIGMSREALVQAIHDTLDANRMTTDVHIRLMVTRGRKKKPNCSKSELDAAATQWRRSTSWTNKTTSYSTGSVSLARPTTPSPMPHGRVGRCSTSRGPSPSPSTRLLRAG